MNTKALKEVGAALFFGCLLGIYIYVSFPKSINEESIITAQITDKCYTDEWYNISAGRGQSFKMNKQYFFICKYYDKYSYGYKAFSLKNHKWQYEHKAIGDTVKFNSELIRGNN